MASSTSLTNLDNLRLDGILGEGRGKVYGYSNEYIQTATASTAVPSSQTVRKEGVSIIPATTAQAGNKAYLLETPDSTYSTRKTIYVNAQSTDAKSYIYASATGAVTFDGTNFVLQATSTHNAEGYINLVSVSATRWITMGYTTTMTLGTTGL